MALSNRAAHVELKAAGVGGVVSAVVAAACGERRGAHGHGHGWGSARLAHLARRLLPSACSPHGGASPPYSRGTRPDPVPPLCRMRSVTVTTFANGYFINDSRYRTYYTSVVVALSLGCS